MSQVEHRSRPDVSADGGWRPAARRVQRPSPHVLSVAGITLLALALGLVRLGRDGFWRDEVFSAYIATRPFGQTWSIILERELNMGLYYVLLSGWTTVSDSEWWVRAFSVLAMAATVPVVIAVARRLAGPRVALLAGLLLALSPCFLYYGRFSRAYALTMLLASLSSWCLLGATEARNRSRWAAYAVITVLMVVSTPLAALVVAAHVVALLGTRPRPIGFPGLIAVYGAIGVLVAPVLFLLLFTQGEMSDWIDPLSLSRIAGAVSDLSGAPVLVPAYFLAAVAWLVAVVRGCARGSHPLAVPLVTAWLVLPPVVIVLVSVVKPLLVGRYLSFIVPAMVVVLAWAINQIPYRRVALAALGAVLLLDVVSLVERNYVRPEPEDVRAAARAVTSQARDGDAVLFDPAHLRMAITWYLDRRPAGQLAPDDIAVARTDAEVGDEFPEELDPTALTPIVEDRSRVWVVAMPEDGWRPVPESASFVIEDTVRSEYRLDHEHSYGTIVVQLYVQEQAGRR